MKLFTSVHTHRSCGSKGGIFMPVKKAKKPAKKMAAKKKAAVKKAAPKKAVAKKAVKKK